MTVLEFDYKRMAAIVQSGKATHKQKNTFKLLDLKVESEYLTDKISKKFNNDDFRRLNNINIRINTLKISNGIYKS